ncbi:PREDICTED: uncharacterized protein LOC105450502 [Wasmannia auropunctata]|uniref:uncharacterized protein LOC105450502 n=1 Tax=Wasmannia auropunctata TaxID=64793 RepID=UPI0005F00DDC|nr:PREDICTED: uncharacterized protein LOC105450502 [Wasmannia auropunctata]
MNFQNVNPLNVRLNMISGNLLPMTSDDSSFHVAWKVYSIVIWIIELYQTIATVRGFVLVANSETLQDAGTISIVISVEVCVLLARMYANRDLASQLIQKLNSILRSEGESMEGIVHSTLKQLEIPLKFYSIAGTGSVIVYCSLPLALIFKKKYFFYEDYGMMAAFSKQPFSTKVFVLGNTVETIASMFIFLKKVAMDVYMINLVLLMTAQYRYIAVKLATILRNNISQNEDREFQKKYYSADLSVEKQMKEFCRHYNTIILMTLMLKKFLSLNMSLIFLTNIILFCFLDIIIINASKEVTDKAFHEKWYQFGPSLKHMFRMIIIANNLNTKLSISEKFSLSLPSFLSILNQSYSIALLLLKMK